MGDVYSYAVPTIIAAGNQMDEGLPGVRAELARPTQEPLKAFIAFLSTTKSITLIESLTPPAFDGRLKRT